MQVWQTSQFGASGLAIVLLASGVTLLLPVSAQGQLIPDNTLGGESSSLNTGDVIDLIEGGATRGNALFHSFEDFNVDAGQQVYFANPDGIDHVLSRVTGLSPSQIDGLLGVNGGADLFLLNPNGIVFGPDAQLDVEGAFLASTSDRFPFADGSEFRAINPNAAPLVTVNLPLGLQLAPDALTPILNEADLQARQGLTLIGSEVISTGQLGGDDGPVTLQSSNGNIQVQRLEAQSAQLRASEELVLTNSRLVTIGDLTLAAGDTVQIRDSVEAPFVAATGGTLVIEGGDSVDIFALNHPDSGLVAGGDLILRSPNPVIGDANYLAYGNFRIETLEGELGDLLSPNDPVIRVSGDVEFDSYFGESLHIIAGGSVTVSGNITITGADSATGLVETITLSNGETVVIDGQQQGTLDIRAGTNAFEPTDVIGLGEQFLGLDLESLEGDPTGADITVGSINIPSDGLVLLSTQFEPNLNLDAGDITITNDDADLDVSGNSILTTGGDVIVDARGDLRVAASIDTSAFGDAGAIQLAAVGDVDIGGDVRSDAAIATDSFGGGSGGIAISSTDGSIDLAQGTVATRAISEGLIGNILISAEGNITTADVTASANAIPSGSITIQSESGDIDTSAGIIQTSNVDRSSAGDIVLEAAAGSVVTSSVASATNAASFAADDAGDITIAAGADVVITDSVSSLVGGNGGNSGDITVTGANVRVEDAVIDSVNEGDGLTGDIAIAADQALNIDDGRIATATGAIDLTGNDMALLETTVATATGDVAIAADNGNIAISDSEVSTQTGDAAIAANNGTLDISDSDITNQSGPLAFTADTLTVTDGSTLAAVNDSGPTSDLNINVGDLQVDDSAIQVLSAEDAAGTLNIAARSISLSDGILETATAVGNDAGAGSIVLTLSEDADNGLTLANESRITATNNDPAGAGANITITGGFLVAEEPTGPNGSDIFTIIEGGDSGNIVIDVLTLDGIELRPELTPFNDIVGNAVTLTIDPVDPTDDLPEVPSELLAVVAAGVESEPAEDLPEFVNVAARNSEEADFFVCEFNSILTVGGRGGLPTLPTDLLTAASPSEEDWVSLTEFDAAMLTDAIAPDPSPILMPGHYTFTTAPSRFPSQSSNPCH